MNGDNKIYLRKKCPGCGRDNCENRNVFSRQFESCREIVPFRHYNVYSCTHCGLSYAGDIEEAMPLGEYYEKMSRYEGDNFTLSPKLLNHYRFTVETLIPLLEKDAKILDIGCAFGGLLNEFKNAGYHNLLGVEPSQKNCDYARLKYDIQVIPGALGDENLDLKKGEFDLVILSGVLEHLMEIRPSVEFCHSLLKENGMLAVIVPDTAMFEEHKDLFQEFSIEHINYFGIDSLTNIMQGMCFEPLVYKQEHESLMGLCGNMVTAWKKVDYTKEKDPATENDSSYIDEYISLCKSYADEIRNRIKEYDLSKGYYVWGAGTNTAILVQLGILEEELIKGVVDSNKNYHGSKAYGNEICDPLTLKNEEVLPVIISSQYAFNSILNAKQKMGLTNSVINLFE